MIKYLDLQKITAMHADEYREAVLAVTDSGRYLLGPAVEAFEHTYAAYIGTHHCIGCGNGLDALTLIFRAYIEMGVMRAGDEVIVPANTYIASILSITENGLTPVLVEPAIDTFQIDPSLVERAITPRTRALLLVHLYGRCAYNHTLATICQRHGLKLIEDNAQAHGCLFEGRRTGSLGDIAAHSFYPGKNLGAFGDAGAVTTNDHRLADIVRALGNYGSSRKYVFPYRGVNSRLDELQAAVLSVKLKYLDADNARRKTIARYYADNIRNPRLQLPDMAEPDAHVFHIYPLLCKDRDRLQQYLADCGIETLIHYPIPPHRQDCYPEWHTLSLPVTEQIHREELSIPLHPALSDTEIHAITEALNAFRS